MYFCPFKISTGPEKGIPTPFLSQGVFPHNSENVTKVPVARETYVTKVSIARGTYVTKVPVARGTTMGDHVVIMLCVTS